MDEPTTEHEPDSQEHDLTPRQADIFVVGWASFLAAGLGSMLMFAWVDPLVLAEVAEGPLPTSRMPGYAVGFFFLWLLCLLAGALSVYLVRTQHEHPKDGAKGL